MVEWEGGGMIEVKVLLDFLELVELSEWRGWVTDGVQLIQDALI
jgi:hypothetical protein